MKSTEIMMAHVFERGGATVLARVRGPDGTYITPGSMQSIRCTVFDVATEQPVADHNDIELAPADHVFETMEQDDRWRVDAVGYNFRHAIAAEAFPGKGHYRIEYQFIAATGARWWAVVRVRAHSIWSST